ncbi:MAG TPA: GNAT family N-acetyltransferase [Trueperaceae bacterium]
MGEGVKGKTSRTTDGGRMVEGQRLEVLPATADRWTDLEKLFGKSGAYSGCWCMYWRVSSNEFAANGNAGNRTALERLTGSGIVPGLLGYRDGEPVGWISLAPREQYGRLQRSPKLKPVDDQPVWAVVCFFVHREHRGRGVAGGLLDGAIAYARSNGATVIEAYPPDSGADRLADPAAYMGTVSLFRRAGFREIARRGPKRPIFRLTL